MRIAGIATVTTVFVLSACGSVPVSDSSYEDTSPGDIEKDVADAMGKVTSFHVAGKTPVFSFDLAIAESGDCVGEMSIKGQGSLEMIVVDGDGFIKPDKRFWRSQVGRGAGTVIETVGDKWVASDPREMAEGDACNWEQFTSDFDGQVGDGITEVTGTDKVDGDETVTVSFMTDDGNPGVAQVLASDPHYVVKLAVEKEGHLTFSDFDEPVEPKAPTDVIDLNRPQ
jgi:hypothetical protein